MGRVRNENPLQALRSVYKRGGLRAFYQGFVPKQVEAISKGAVLLFVKNAVAVMLKNLFQMEGVIAGLLAGGVGGVSQALVMAPCTYVVTALVTSRGKGGDGWRGVVATTYRERGIGGFYQGASALAARQATNWASRQALTDTAQRAALRLSGGAALGPGQRLLAGAIGGALSVWNQPFEVLRIEAQAAAAAATAAAKEGDAEKGGGGSKGTGGALQRVLAESGWMGLWRGWLPRALLGTWQTMVYIGLASFL